MSHICHRAFKANSPHRRLRYHQLNYTIMVNADIVNMVAEIQDVLRKRKFHSNLTKKEKSILQVSFSSRVIVSNLNLEWNK